MAHFDIVFNPFPNERFYESSKLKEFAENNFKFDEMEQSSPRGSKTLWGKENFLITSNFSFSHSVFKRLILQTGKNQVFIWKRLISFESTSQISYMPGFHSDYYKDHLNVKDIVWEKTGPTVKVCFYVYCVISFYYLILYQTVLTFSDSDALYY